MTATSAPKITPEEAHAKMKDEGFVYVDVRADDEFAAGRPAGAVHVPVASPDFVAAMEKRFAKDAPIIVGCKAGVRSARAAAMLVAAGFTRVLDQSAGWDGKRGAFGETIEPGWLRAGLPVERG
jgi:rhodanese-related sulfurtransferase